MNAQGMENQEPLALGAVACGVLAFVFSCCCGAFGGHLLGLPLAVASIILGFLAKKKIEETQGPDANKTFAMAGMGLGATHLVLTIVLVVVSVLMFGGLTLFGALQ